MSGHVLAKQEHPYGNNRSYSFNTFGSVFSILLCLVDRKLILESKILISWKKKQVKQKKNQDLQIFQRSYLHFYF